MAASLAVILETADDTIWLIKRADSLAKTVGDVPEYCVYRRFVKVYPFLVEAHCVFMKSGVYCGQA